MGELAPRAMLVLRPPCAARDGSACWESWNSPFHTMGVSCIVASGMSRVILLSGVRHVDLTEDCIERVVHYY